MVGQRSANCAFSKNSCMSAAFEVANNLRDMITEDSFE